MPVAGRGWNRYHHNSWDVVGNLLVCAAVAIGVIVVDSRTILWLLS
jgi:hypothetical protein